MAIERINIQDFLSCVPYDGFIPNTLGYYQNMQGSQIFDLGYNLRDATPGANIIELPYLKIVRDDNNSTISIFVFDGSTWQFGGGWGIMSGGTYFEGLMFCIDSSIERGSIFRCANIAYGSYWIIECDTTNVPLNNTKLMYDALMNSVPVLYTWSSVPAISGKNGILTLSTLKSGSINNGNPVSDATLNAFEILIEASNVGKLVLDTDIDENQVVIRYNIPNNTYQYVKLVYKENYAPESISDGVAIDIQQTDTQLVLDDITTTGTYYFKIFTDNGNSNTVVLNYVGIIPIIIKIERVW